MKCVAPRVLLIPLFAALLGVACSDDTSGTGNNTSTGQEGGAGTSTDAETDTTEDTGESDSDSDEPIIEGLNSLYMGHSYFRRQAEAMPDFAELAGIDGHSSTTFFRGGYNGSAFAIWNDPESRATIEGYLDAGNVEMLGMTIFVDLEADESDGAHPDNQTQGLKNWIEYATAQNPDTIFFVALPWLGRPLDYVGDTGDPQTSGYEAYGEAILESEGGIRPLIDDLRNTFPDSEVFLLAYAQGSL